MNNIINGLESYTADEIKELVEQHADDVIEQTGLDIEVYGIHVHGSRLYNRNRKDSDLDIVIFYRGEEREDDVFNTFIEYPYYIEGIKCDFNPILIYGIGAEAERQVEIYKLKHDDAYYDEKDRLNEDGECCCGNAVVYNTPMNTVGVGDVVPAGRAAMTGIELASDAFLGSGDILTAGLSSKKRKRKNKRKKKVDYFFPIATKR